MISVCIASYNGARYIREQIESIVAQLDDNDEIIVCDDHSTDDTVAIVKSLPYQQSAWLKMRRTWDIRGISSTASPWHAENISSSATKTTSGSPTRWPSV